MERVVYILFEFGYTITFGILGVITLLLHIPKDKEMVCYKKARFTLGAALLALSLSCIIRLIYPQYHTEYIDFWLLVTFTLAHSWLTYSTMLFLLEAPKYLTKRFIIDGAVPVAIMIICGFAGLIFPDIQKAIQILFGLIFGIKCIYMFYICLCEYRKCKMELDNYYDETPDIKWICNLIYLSLFMSVVTIVTLYVTSIQFVYYLSIPIIYTYIVFKILNFAIKKIDAIRKQNITMDKPAVEKKKDNGLTEKISPKIEQWVAAKGYCMPELNIKDVATRIGTNQNYLSQYLNSQLNMTFQIWLNSLRIEESKSLLTDGTRKSIEEVGTMVGFSHVYNFSRWFRIMTGTTPLRYRKGA